MFKCPAGERLTHRTTTSDRGKAVKRYWTSVCSGCAIKKQCTTGNERRVRPATVEHPFGTIKSWMGATHFQMKTLPSVSIEMSLHVLSYNMKRTISLLGTEKIIATIRA